MPFCSFDLKPGFDLKKATSELETRYLENVALRLKIDPRDFLKEWSKVKKSVAPLTRDQMRTLLKNNFAID
jgi:hypothetical protein